VSQIVRKKLIEVDMPLPGIDEPSARLKQKAPKGYPTKLHKWWAQTPVPAARAVLFAQLVDDPSSWPDRFPTQEEQVRERQRLHEVMVGNLDLRTNRWVNGITDWGSDGATRALEKARYEIARCVAWERNEEPPTEPDAVIAYLQEYGPVVLDPFCGSGTIPQEAQRLGLPSIGSDLNPVAVLISKALVEIPPKFAGQPPLNPNSRSNIARGGRWNAKGAQGLAEDVRHYGRWVHEEAFKRIGHLYPQTSLADGSKANVIAWFWARTVASPNPAAGGAHVPLVSSFMLSNKEGKKVWVEPVIDPGAPSGWRFGIRTGHLTKADEEKARSGTKGARESFLCVLTGAPMTYSYIDDEANSGRMRARLMAIAAEGPRGRVYIQPDDYQSGIAESASPTWRPEQECRGTFGSNAQGRIYGFRTFADYFTPRQLVALNTLSGLIPEARKKVIEDARAADFSATLGKTDGQASVESYADAVAIYLGMALSRHLQFGSTQSTWYVKDQAVKGLPQQGMTMTWDYCEASPFGDSSANFSRCADIAGDCAAATPAIGSSLIEQRPAQNGISLGSRPILVSTDPPYYDNVIYADLADFFHVWLRRALRNIFPTLTATVTTPKREELVATHYRDREGVDPDVFWLDGMSAALRHVHAVSGVEPTTIYYAYKQQESNGEERAFSSTGWATFLQAICDTGFIVDGTWALRVNNPSRKVAQGTNALASAVILVCRKRPAGAAITTRAAFLRDLKRELPASLKLLQAGNIAPVDLAQASIGPGMAIFSRSAKVLGADDTPMSVKAALQDINAALDTFLSEQESEYDAYTRFSITWFEELAMDTGAYGRAETLATSRGISVSGVRDAGIIESGGGKVRLRRREEMDADWDPAKDKNITVWECTQHLIRRLMGEDGSEDRAARLLAALGHRTDLAKDLAYRLYGICERKKWADEAYSYNALVASWPRLVDRAKNFGQAAEQADLGL
jgi:putative DNA methylase